jgi:hypothetical protein
VPERGIPTIKTGTPINAPTGDLGEEVGREGGDDLIDLSAQRHRVEPVSRGRPRRPIHRVRPFVGRKGFIETAGIVERLAQCESRGAAVLDCQIGSVDKRCDAGQLRVVRGKLLAESEVAVGVGKIRFQN